MKPGPHRVAVRILVQRKVIMPDPTRFERCGDHQVRNCLVCHPIAKPMKVSEIPAVPDFPNDGQPDAEPKNVLIPGPVVIAEVESPLVSAAVRYTQACNVHAKAQREVSRLKEQLDAAKINETNAHADRVRAQEEMAKLVAAEAA